MRGRKPDAYKLPASDWRYLNELANEGQLIQRVATRARALLALARGERIVAIVRWLGISRTSIWELWQRYLERGVEAVFDEERSGRPLVFSPSRTCQDRARRLHRPSDVWTEPESLGLPLSAASRSRASNR
jgi:biotin operon repressor